MKKIAVFGACGQLGKDILEAFRGFDLAEFDVDNCDICDREGVSEKLEEFRPEYVIHAAAWGDVESAEKDAYKAITINSIGTENVAAAAAGINACLIYISTDFVFSGEKGTAYTEEDLPSPVNVYGLSKLLGEHFVRALCKRYCIVRTSGLCGLNKCLSKGSNFVDKILEKARTAASLEIVNDQTVSPTSTSDLAKQLKVIVENDVTGIVHAVNKGALSWYDFAKLIVEIAGLDAKTIPVTSDRYPSSVKRPKNSSLECRVLKDKGLYIMQDTKSALTEYIKLSRPTDEK